VGSWVVDHSNQIEWEVIVLDQEAAVNRTWFLTKYQLRRPIPIYRGSSSKIPNNNINSHRRRKQLVLLDKFARQAGKYHSKTPLYQLRIVVDMLVESPSTIRSQFQAAMHLFVVKEPCQPPVRQSMNPVSSISNKLIPVTHNLQHKAPTTNLKVEATPYQTDSSIKALEINIKAVHHSKAADNSPSQPSAISKPTPPPPPPAV